MNNKTGLDLDTNDAILNIHQQKEVLKTVSILTLVIFVPLAIKNVLIGETVLAIVLLAFEISLLLEVAAIIYNDHRLIGNFIPLSLLGLSVIMAIDIFGALATYWVFPILIALVFLFPQRTATVTNSLLIIGVTATIYPQEGAEVTARYAFSLVATVVIVHVVVKEVRKLQSELRHLLERDSMTGALNRHQLHSSLDNAIEKYGHSTIVMVDIDDFKSINDNYGHDVGDKVIMQIVDSIAHNTRPEDLLFRLGGDEFLLLFHGIDQYAVEAIMNLVSQNVAEQPYPFNVKVTLSCGVAESIPFETSHAWMKRADLALYQSKSLGKNRVSIYCDSTQSQLAEYLETTSDKHSNLVR
tara:strand:+ start:81 stop:1145 length:1065 start_codon:yes stop_codon:yes gene_type:complete